MRCSRSSFPIWGSEALAEKSDLVISLKGIVNRFGDQVLHDGLALDVQRGEVIGINPSVASSSNAGTSHRFDFPNTAPPL